MLYLKTNDLEELGLDWKKNTEMLRNALEVIKKGEFSQPIKPYLKFNDKSNRIIAMPAYAGGDIEIAGIKWIASFPKNIEKGIQRANSVTVLNNSETGEPIAFINTALISVIRTASVSALLIEEYIKHKNPSNLTLGIIGFGPIGQMHLKMATDLLGDRIKNIKLFDIAGIPSSKLPIDILDKIEICTNWEDVYLFSDIFITCTVSSEGYIDKKPKDHALLLNVSLRDFKTDILKYTKSIVVDNWEEVCRADTDIEKMSKEGLLFKEDTISLVELICENKFNGLANNQAIMFNPMGLAIFDIVIAKSYYQEALKKEIGTLLT
jgi:N-[(2S)-2-amino-2-carboxyethyl]-L-glutamate dehydrogenase